MVITPLHPSTRVYSLITISFSISASSLILSEILQPLHGLYAASALWNGLPKDLRQFAHAPNPHSKGPSIKDVRRDGGRGMVKCGHLPTGERKGKGPCGRPQDDPFLSIVSACFADSSYG